MTHDDHSPSGSWPSCGRGSLHRQHDRRSSSTAERFDWNAANLRSEAENLVESSAYRYSHLSRRLNAPSLGPDRASHLPIVDNPSIKKTRNAEEGIRQHELTGRWFEYDIVDTRNNDPSSALKRNLQ